MNVHVSGRIFRGGMGGREEGIEGRTPYLLWPAYALTLTLPSVSRARSIAPFTCLTPLLHCTTPRALILP